jgi:hypothetical protein
MRLVKRMLPGSAAALFAVAGAQAGDLPVKPKPVEYVKVCTLYGAGFYYIPGTDACIKIGAFVRLDVNYNGDGTGVPLGGAQGGLNSGAGGLGGAFTRANSQVNFRERSDASFDMRTQTEYGTLRSYIDVGQQLQTFRSSVGGAFSFTPLANGASFETNSVYIDRAFIQFAGLTAGKMSSLFDIVSVGKYSLSQSRLPGDASLYGIVGAAYTWQFGGGLSASLSLEDSAWATGGRGRSTVNLAGGGSAPGASDASTAFGFGAIVPDNKGQQFFDPVMNIRLDQSWGLVGMALAAHDASGGNYGAAASPNFSPVEPGTCSPSFTTCGGPGDAWGGAASLGFKVVDPFGLAGDSLGAQGVYAMGAVGYATAQWGASAIYGPGNNAGLSYLVDGVYDNGTSVTLTKTWSLNGFYEHVWNPQWRTSLYGGMLGIDFGDGKSLICANPASPLGFSTTSQTSASGGQSVFVAGTVSNCNPNSSWSQLGTRTMWNPLPDLDIGFDVAWVHLNTAFGGTATLQPLGFGTRPGGLYAISDQDVFSAFFRVQRSFLY